MSPKKSIKKLIFSSSAREDLAFWETTSPKTIQRINALLAAILADPESGIGKPEKLKYELAGLWSRRINLIDRLVYEIQGDTVYILQLREHY
jgi:toxin YoeB